MRKKNVVAHDKITCITNKMFISEIASYFYIRYLKCLNTVQWCFKRNEQGNPLTNGVLLEMGKNASSVLMAGKIQMRKVQSPL